MYTKHASSHSVYIYIYIYISIYELLILYTKYKIELYMKINSFLNFITNKKKKKTSTHFIYLLLLLFIYIFVYNLWLSPYNQSITKKIFFDCNLICPRIPQNQLLLFFPIARFIYFFFIFLFFGILIYIYIYIKPITYINISLDWFLLES